MAEMEWIEAKDLRARFDRAFAERIEDADAAREEAKKWRARAYEERERCRVLQTKNANLLPAGPRYQHKKRGSIVTEIARGFAQVSTHPIEEMTAVVIYRHADGIYWVRNAVEFDDGRFELLPNGKPTA